MTWIETAQPGPDRPALAAAFQRALASYPAEYSPAARGLRQLPPEVADDSIVLAPSLIPPALEGFFAGYGALLDPSLPLTRREHELIASVVSATNACFY